LDAGIGLVELLSEQTQVFPSKGECRKMLQGGGVSLNKEKVNDAAAIIKSDSLIKDKYLFIQKGKKNYYLISIK
jgi:tyrosyl-tRNA synthetase